MNKPTAGPWYWHIDHQGHVSLRTPDRGQLVVMDLIRHGRRQAAPIFAIWPNMDEGEERGRRGGILEGAAPDHPDARAIAAAGSMVDAFSQIAIELGPHLPHANSAAGENAGVQRAYNLVCSMLTKVLRP